MKKSIIQEIPYSCGIACFTFVADLTYEQAEKFLGEEQSKNNRFFVKHFREELNRFGLNYKSKHIRPNQEIESNEGMIVLIRRSKQFPVGHYLVYYNGRWMDPWINLSTNNDIAQAVSGFRDEPPGEAMYALYRF